jgi:hypothetical protein
MDPTVSAVLSKWVLVLVQNCGHGGVAVELLHGMHRRYVEDVPTLEIRGMARSCTGIFYSVVTRRPASRTT